MAQSRLTICPLPLDEANAFVAQHHRHHLPVRGHKFSIGVADEAGRVRGVAIVGRPDGCDNAGSALYAAAWRAGRAMGYRRLGTYILKSEPGTSLRAAGWVIVHQVTGRSWSCESRPRVDKHPTEDKLPWAPAGSGDAA
jgi:hypothetical protein